MPADLARSAGIGAPRAGADGANLAAVKPDSGWHRLPSRLEADQLVVDDHYKVMKRWETPLMQRMAEILLANLERTRIIEVGFGMGISAGALQDQKIERHTIIEPHPEMFERLRQWRAERPQADIRPVHDYWQNQAGLFAEADGIFFDTYAEDVPALVDENVSFLVEAASHLKPGAAVALFWILPTIDEVQQEKLYSHYRRIVIERVPVEPGTTGVNALARLGFLLAIIAIK
ncbi:class I SAM-dependent methyltransferase [Micromonospora sp. NPDC007220]|uniref:class I SAM-dependent methyltransferase n=1 Tax=Micromonospora sp. NPDC007220 TaxID=3154318 RepID=UPI0033C97C31